MILQIRFQLLLLRLLIIGLHLLLELLFLFDIIHLFLDFLSFCFGTSPIAVGIIIFESLFALFIIFLFFILVQVLLDVGLTVLFTFGGVPLLFWNYVELNFVAWSSVFVFADEVRIEDFIRLFLHVDSGFTWFTSAQAARSWAIEATLVEVIDSALVIVCHSTTVSHLALSSL